MICGVSGFRTGMQRHFLGLTWHNNFLGTTIVGGTDQRGGDFGSSVTHFLAPKALKNGTLEIFGKNCGK